MRAEDSVRLQTVSSTGGLCRLLFPHPGRLSPVGAQQGVGVLHQFGQWLLGLGASAVQVFAHLGLAVKVVQLESQGRGIRQHPVAHHHPWGLHQPCLDGVVQAEVADHPGDDAAPGR